MLPKGNARSNRTKVGDVRIGISGWTYAPWRGIFYPEKLPHAQELAFAASRFRTIEINGTFYSTQRPSSFVRWAQQTPDDFIFSVKGPRFITHMRRLREVERPLANFLASGILALGRKLGPILWQLPPNFAYDAALLEDFFQRLPQSTTEAAQQAQHHDSRFRGRVLTETDAKLPMRHALEVRHPSFVTPSLIRLLRKHKIALVCADSVEWPRLMEATTNFIYCRLHGSEQLYASGYGSKAIAMWCEWIRAWSVGEKPKGVEEPEGERVLPFAASERRPHDVFVYFDNDAKVRAPKDAAALQRCMDRRQR